MSPKSYYRKLYFEILDQAELGYCERFELNNADLKYCMYAENCILKKYGGGTMTGVMKKGVFPMKKVSNIRKIISVRKKTLRLNFRKFMGMILQILAG